MCALRRFISASLAKRSEVHWCRMVWLRWDCVVSSEQRVWRRAFCARRVDNSLSALGTEDELEVVEDAGFGGVSGTSSEDVDEDAGGEEDWVRTCLMN
jgi:hypothetical protein